MRYVEVESGVVVNAVLADEETATERGWIAHDRAGPGWTYDGKTFSPPPEDPTPVPSVDHVERLFSDPAIDALIRAIDDGDIPTGQALGRDEIKKRVRDKM